MRVPAIAIALEQPERSSAKYALNLGLESRRVGKDVCF